MINYPIIYHRNSSNDFPARNDPFIDETWEKCQKVALSIFPLLSLHRPLCKPLSVGLSGLRSITHSQQMIESFKDGKIREGSLHLLHTLLATSAIALAFFNYSLSLLASSYSDLITNSRDCIEQIKAGHLTKAAETFAYLMLDLLFIGSFMYGSIEVTVACMMLQITLNLFASAKNLKNGEYLEGICQAIMGGAHIYRSIPQVKLLQWKWQSEPVFTAELKQTSNGFVYLDIPDEYLQSLLKQLGNDKSQLPPYFGPDRAGAHISAISADEVAAKGGIKIPEIGKKYAFRFVHADQLKPERWQGVDQVQFVTVSCDELETMRKSNGFSPKISDHDFHLTFGIQPTIVT